MKYKLKLCIMYALSITSLCTAMDNTEIFLKNNYITDLSYAELPIVLILGSKKVTLQPNVLQQNIKTLPKGTQVKLNDTNYGLCIGTPVNFQLAYYDPGSDTYQGGISDISYIIQEIQQNKHNHPHHDTTIITINHSFNPKYLVTNTWNLNITWNPPKLKPACKIKIMTARLRANPELINIDIDTYVPLLLISEIIDIEKSAIAK
jgi:hypothetical protein